LQLDALRVGDAAAPSASEHDDEKPVLCQAPGKDEEEGEGAEKTVLCIGEAPGEGEEGDSERATPVRCLGDAPERGDDDAAADVEDLVPPAGLAERWREEAGDAATASFEQVWDELKAFLVTCSTSAAPRRPTARVDVLWHEFILFTRDYHAFCNRLGGYVHHTPEVPVEA
jgi:hypothetical protein